MPIQTADGHSGHEGLKSGEHGQRLPEQTGQVASTAPQQRAQGAQRGGAERPEGNGPRPGGRGHVRVIPVGAAYPERVRAHVHRDPPHPEPRHGPAPIHPELHAHAGRPGPQRQQHMRALVRRDGQQPGQQVHQEHRQIEGDHGREYAARPPAVS
ncbi:hypothetical protein [Deinococcus sp. UR1]|uniref:hypothetical protein n=1 Tax=Deinococcus sp. UR1 TaxID=1704277 RepID=UPI0013045B39|nr:hypothetical protein [Deinococcus sp. UR1]